MPTKKKAAARKKKAKAAPKAKPAGRWVWVADPRKAKNPMFDVTVSLIDVEPKIWRRFLIARTSTFAELHQAIQDACGWKNYHAWAFRDAKGRDDIAGVFEDVPDGRKVKLALHVVGAKGARFIYEYDFGDGWLHQVDVKSTDETGSARRLVDGARSFPPEDCGGLGGYERYVEFIETGVDPWGEDAADVKGWLGRWTPDGFKYATVAKKFDA